MDRNMTFGFQIWFLSLQETIKLILWYGVFFFGFFNEVDSWGCVGFLYCLAKIFASFLGGFCWDFLEISL